MYRVSIIFICLNLIHAEKILVHVPTPSISHQVIFYPLVKELVNRGHEVVFFTTDAMYPDGNGPDNLTEIDTHDKSYEYWRKQIKTRVVNNGHRGDIYRQYRSIFPSIDRSFEVQVSTPEFQELIKNKTHFDLLILEACARPTLAVSHIFKAPVILMSSFGSHFGNMDIIGAPTYPKLLYPYHINQKVNNLSLIEKLHVLYDVYNHETYFTELEVEQNLMVKRLFGEDTPSLRKLGDNVQMLFLNVYPIWELNRPVPPSVMFIGGIHQKPKKELPQDLKSYLDSSKKGVVYFSLGTNINPSTLDPQKIKALVGALSKLPYDVLVKWDKDELPVRAGNVKVARWFPQSDLLRHPKIKVFITQGGLQSFDETLTAGVPVVGIPILADQWYNVERFVKLGLGVRMLIEDLTEDRLIEAVNTVISDPSYRQNMLTLREKLRDQPQSALDRAVWWTEHILKHGGSHLRAPAANMTWTEYLDLELLAVLLLAAVSAVAVAAVFFYWIWTTVVSLIGVKIKID